MEKLLLLDLDGTILKSSCVLEFASHIINTGVIKHNDIHYKWLSNKKNDDYIREFAEYFRNEIIGLKTEYVEKLFNDFFNKYKFEYNDRILNLIQECKENNFYCMIISGTIDFMVKKIANHLGINGIGSVYTLNKNNEYTGGIDIPMFSQKEKQRIIDSLINNNVVEVIGAGDTTSDIPIAMISDTFYLVDPNISTIKEYSELDIEYVLL